MSAHNSPHRRLIQIKRPSPFTFTVASRRIRKGDGMSDFCYSRPMLDRVFQQAELMDRMMARVGVDPALAARVDSGMAWYEARTGCIACCHEPACRQWLEKAAAVPAPPEFCANTEFFRSCLESDPGTAATSAPPAAPRSPSPSEEPTV
jgi:hypothetical protein